MHSCLYNGQVRHRRFAPARHEFEYRLFMLYLDLDELPGLFDRFWLWSSSRPNLAWFRRADHLGDPERPLAECVRDLVEQRSGRRPHGPVRLLTHLRYCGHGFNPVSFYYCFDPTGKTVEHIIAEVNNTPWGEQHCYLLNASPAQQELRVQRFVLEKQFHVSPFMGMDIHYQWSFARPGNRLFAHLKNSRDGDKLFDATLSLERKPITSASLSGALLRYPLMTLRIMVAIYYQALRLWLKKTPFFTHPAKKGGTLLGEDMMKASLVSATHANNTQYRPGILNSLVKRAVIGRLAGLKYGSLTLIDGDDCRCFGDRRSGEPHLTLTIDDPAAWVDVARGGGLGAGESYMAGRWHTDDLTGLAQLFLRNPQVLYGLHRGTGSIMSLLNKIWHALQRNTPNGSRRNIAAHYDLGNELFSVFLDDTMMYSCAIFDDPRMTLQQASVEKLERVCCKLDLQPDDHLLEIGTGWGGLAIHAASHHGCRVTTTTISREQYLLAQQRIQQAGVADRVTVICEDYRKLTGQYDKLISIEMIEAVGHEYFDTYFEKCSSLIKPDGLMLLQAITIADQRYAAARRSVDFIQRYIFPGGCLPSVAVLSDAVARNTDMRIVHLEDIGAHYATTLKHWRERFLNRLDEVRALGYPEEFIRMWEYYLCYCEGGFRERAIGTAQVLLGKPLNRREALLTSLRLDQERAA